MTLEEQRAHWNRISRTYSFQLAYPEIRLERSYVLQVWFEHEGKRLTSQVVLEAQEATNAATQPTTGPSSQPTSGPASRPGGG